MYGDDFGKILNKAARLSKGRLNKKLSDLGITFPQFSVIRHLKGNQEKVKKCCTQTPASIAEQLWYDRPTMTGIIERLEKQGLVTRENSLSDRRSHRIMLTDKALELLQKTDVSIREVDAMTFEGFEKKEIENINDYLLRIIENLEGQECNNKEEADGK